MKNENEKRVEKAEGTLTRVDLINAPTTFNSLIIFRRIYYKKHRVTFNKGHSFKFLSLFSHNTKKNIFGILNVDLRVYLPRLLLRNLHSVFVKYFSHSHPTPKMWYLYLYFVPVFISDKHSMLL